METALFTAQIRDDAAGELDAAGARGGPDALITQPFYIGLNDNFGDSQTHAPFTPIVFDLYNAWSSAGGGNANGLVAQRRAIARGQALFNTRAIHITGVSGLNDEAAFGNPAATTPSSRRSISA
jgi:cytochrome c peroxidase